MYGSGIETVLKIWCILVYSYKNSNLRIWKNMLFRVKNLMKLRKISLVSLFLCIPINFIGAFFSIKFLVIIGVSLLFIFLAISFIF